MAKLIGLSGAQGAGKTTLLEGLKARGWTVDDFKVSRHVQAELGFSSLSEATQTEVEVKRFQEAIYKAKLKHDQELNQRPEELILVERTFADIYVYSSQWIYQLLDQKLNQLSFAEHLSWLARMKEVCVNGQQQYSGVLLLPYMQHVAWVEDERRASRDTAAQVFEEIEFFNSGAFTQPIKQYKLTKASVEDRLNEVEAWLKQHD